MSDSCEIRTIQKGPTPETDDMTLAITFTYSVQAVDALKELIHYQDRGWIAENKTWYAKHSDLESIKAWARAWFDEAMLIDGNRWEDLATGRIFIQGDLFDGEVDVSNQVETPVD